MKLTNNNTKTKKYQQLSLTERHSIQIFLKMNLSCREIAKKLNRSHTTISREIKRNSFEQEFVNPSNNKYSPLTITKTIYNAFYAQNNYAKHKSFCGMYPTKFLPKNILDELCSSIIKNKWSPQVALMAIKKKYPYLLLVCVKTIYNWIYDDCIDVKPKHLLRHKDRKNKNKSRKQGKRIIGKPIDIRPEKANDRSEFGHFEGDSVVGAYNKGQIITLVDRMTRISYTFKFPNKHSKNIVEALRKLKRQLGKNFKLIKTITFDNGTEFYSWQQIEREFKIDTYFAHPYSSYERGSNENFNGRLRKYIPKKTNFKTITKQYLKKVTNIINNTPMKIFNWKTPLEMYEKICC